MQFKCRRNLLIAARMRLECSRNVPIGPRMSPDAIQVGISSSILSVFFTDKFALSQSDARISVAYKICQWKSLTKRLMKCPPEHRRIAYPGIYKEFPVPTSFWLIPPLVWLGFEVPSRMRRKFWKFLIPAGSAWFLLIPSKCDGGIRPSCTAAGIAVDTCAYFHLHNIRRISKYLDQESLLTLTHAFSTSRLDYCNSLLYGAPVTQIEKLQRIQNAAARLITRSPKFCHMGPILRQLHWLPIRSRIHHKIL